MNDATTPITWPPGWGNTDDDDAACRAVAAQLGLAAPDVAATIVAFAAARIQAILDRFPWVSDSDDAEQRRRDHARFIDEWLGEITSGRRLPVTEYLVEPGVFPLWWGFTPERMQAAVRFLAHTLSEGSEK